MDIASLVIKIDSSGVVTMTNHLTGLETKARHVEKATESVSAGFLKMTGAMGLGTSASQYLQRAISELTEAWKFGFNAVEDYKMSIAGLSAMVMSFGKAQKGVDLAGQWKEALKYSTAMVPVLENIASKTLLSGKETIMLNNALARHGVFLDANNAKQMEGFVRLSNALPLLTQGQNLSVQLNQEIRGLMTGQGEQTSMLLMTLKKIDPELEKNLKTWQNQGTVLENISRLLVGFQEPSKILEDTWTTMKSTLETTATQIMRGLMAPVYEELIKKAKELNDVLVKNKTTILEWGKSVVAFYKELWWWMEKVYQVAKLINLANQSPWRPKKGTEAHLWTEAEMTPPSPIPTPPVGITNPEEDKKAVRAREQALKQITEATRQAAFERDAIGMSEYEKDLNRIEQEVDKYRKAGVDKVSITKFVAAETATATAKAAQKNADDLLKSLTIYYEDRDQQSKAAGEADQKRRQEELEAEKKLIAQGLASTLAAIDAEQDAAIAEGAVIIAEAQKALAAKEQAWRKYQDLMKSEAHEAADPITQLRIEENEKLKVLEDNWKKAGKSWEQYQEDRATVSENTAKKIAKTEMELVGQGLSDMEKAFTSISNMYAEGSGEHEKWAKAANAMMVAQKALAVVSAVVAIATQGAGDPYTAFARIAAMAAAMASLLGSIGVGFSGGSVAAPSPAASTVLGAEAGTGSSSLANVTELLKDIHDEEWSELKKIKDEITKLNANITGLVSNIVQNYGKFDPDSMKVHYENTLSDAHAAHQNMYDNIATPIMQLIGKWSGELGNYLFGGDASQEMTAAGFKLGEVTIKSLQSGVDMSVQKYATVTTTTDGGLLGEIFGRHDTTSSEDRYGSVEAEITKLFTEVFKNLGEVAIELAKTFGTDMEAAINYMFPEIKLDFAGLTGDEINTKLNEYISNMGDTMATALFGDLLGKYQKVGEGLLETAIRVAVELQTVRSLLEATGLEMTGSIEQMIEWTQNIVDLAGGLDALQEAVGEYYEGFFSETEKLILSGNLLGKSFAELNMEMPKSRAAFRDLVEGLDLTTETGQAAYVTLMKLAGGVDQYFSAIIDRAGISVSSLSDLITQGLLGQISEADLGGQMANMIIGGVYTAIASTYADTIAQMFIDEIVTPMVVATMAGGQITAAIAAGTIEKIVEYAKAAAAALNILFTDPDFQAAMDEIGVAISGVAGSISVGTPYFEPYVSGVESVTEAVDDGSAAMDAAAALENQRRTLEIELMTLQGKTSEALVAQRELELEAMDESLHGLQEMIWALEDLQKWNDIVVTLLDAMGDATAATTLSRQMELTAINESLRPLQELVWILTDAREAMDVAVDNLKTAFEEIVENLDTATENVKKAFTLITDNLTAAIEQVNRAYDKDIASLRESQTPAGNIISDLTSSRDMLRGARESMQIEGAAAAGLRYNQAKEQMAELIEAVKDGDYSQIKNADQMLAALTGRGTTGYSLSSDYRRDYWQTYNSLIELESLTNDALTTEELILKGITDQITLLEAEQEAFNHEANLLLGIDDSVMSVADAVAAYHVAAGEYSTATDALLEAGLGNLLLEMQGVDLGLGTLSENITAYQGAKTAYDEAVQGLIDAGMTNLLNEMIGVNTSTLSVKTAIDQFKTAESAYNAAILAALTLIAGGAPAAPVYTPSIGGSEPSGGDGGGASTGGGGGYESPSSGGGGTSTPAPGPAPIPVRLLSEWDGNARLPGDTFSNTATSVMTRFIDSLYNQLAQVTNTYIPNDVGYMNDLASGYASGVYSYEDTRWAMRTLLRQAEIAGADISGYAMGGIASGPESGYGARLHGTELIVSPNASYPATVKGGDNVILIEEVRALRAEMKAANYQIAKNTGESVRVQKRWDNDGTPAVRVV